MALSTEDTKKGGQPVFIPEDRLYTLTNDYDCETECPVRN